MKVYSVAVLVVATAAVCWASPIVQPAPVYGPPGAFQRFQLARAMSAAPAAFHSADYHTVLSPPPPPAAPAPAWVMRQGQFYQPAPAPQFYRQQPLRQAQNDEQQRFRTEQFRTEPQQFRTEPQQFRTEPQQFRTEQQGVWRYTAPARAAPIREDQAPHQGLGATDSVTMPEPAPYDPLLVTGPAAAHFVRVLSDNEPHYFPAFPHTRLVLQNQQKRLDNGLNANRLGSIRPGSDFYRTD